MGPKCAVYSPWYQLVPNRCRALIGCLRTGTLRESRRCRYTCWFEVDSATVLVQTEKIIGKELYVMSGFDSSFDWPGNNVNLVGDPAHADVVQELHQMVLQYIQLY